MKPRPDLLSDRSHKGLEVFQLTVEGDVPSSHVYMEAQSAWVIEKGEALVVGSRFK